MARGSERKDFLINSFLFKAFFLGVCSTYGVKLVQQLHEVLLKLKDDLLTLKEKKKKKKKKKKKRKICEYTCSHSRTPISEDFSELEFHQISDSFLELRPLLSQKCFVVT